jgi:tRNA (adenine37-N6)-methyltransferase
MKDILTNFKCQNCRKQVDNRDTSTNNAGSSAQVMDISVPVNSELVHFKPIGHIRSVFNEKRGVPRQPQLGTQLLGCIQLNPDLFTNPEHALQGLEDFSHIWIIYHFHKNAPHYKSKVAPPRLSGQKLGVFGTRSPHRPCPIGLSLVHIDKIENSCIYFYGTDMVDDTPVLDIKPYIPHYDTPSIFAPGMPGNSSRNSSFDRFGSREAPDGEETEFESNGGGAAALPTVKVPQWITDETKLNVTFHKNALTQINEIGVDRVSNV